MWERSEWEFKRLKSVIKKWGFNDDDHERSSLNLFFFKNLMTEWEVEESGLGIMTDGSSGVEEWSGERSVRCPASHGV